MVDGVPIFEFPISIITILTIKKTQTCVYNLTVLIIYVYSRSTVCALFFMKKISSVRLTSDDSFPCVSAGKSLSDI